MTHFDEILWFGAYFFGVLSGMGCGFVVGVRWRRYTQATRDKMFFAKFKTPRTLTERLDRAAARLNRDWAVGRNGP